MLDAKISPFSPSSMYFRWPLLLRQMSRDFGSIRTNPSTRQSVAHNVRKCLKIICIICMFTFFLAVELAVESKLTKGRKRGKSTRAFAGRLSSAARSIVTAGAYLRLLTFVKLNKMDNMERSGRLFVLLDIF